MTLAQRLSLPIAVAVCITISAGAAWADAIDGHWCIADGRRMSIDGPKIVIPSGKAITGDYERHGFRYTVPAGDPGAGTDISMILVNEDLVQLRRAAAATPELWRRCGAPTS
jgi:hypothetical protein